MKFFLDTAMIDEIKEANDLGVLDGVTTNPSLVAQTGKRFHDVVEEICKLVKGPVSAEAVSLNAEGMVADAHELIKIADNVVVKIPIIPEGVKAIGILAKEGIRTNATLCYTPNQALAVAKAGATYVSPFVGRRDDSSGDGIDVVNKIKTIYRNYSYKTEILVASVRSTVHVMEAALVGADVVTMGLPVFRNLLAHPQTTEGMKEFIASWDQIPK